MGWSLLFGYYNQWYFDSCYSRSDSNMFTCEICGKPHQYNKDLLRHKRSAHEGQTYACDKCTKKFKRKDDLKNHEQICQIDLKCPQCQISVPHLTANNGTWSPYPRGEVLVKDDGYFCKRVFKKTRGKTQWRAVAAKNNHLNGSNS